MKKIKSTITAGISLALRIGASRTSIIATAICIIGGAAAYAGSDKSVDLGPLADHAGNQTISVTITLKLRDLAGAEDMMRRISTPTDPLYLRFMLPNQVQAQFGPSEERVAAVVASLRGRGLTVERTTATTLRATGTPTIMERAFQTSLHQFERPATDRAPTLTFHAPTSRPVVPAEIASDIGAVAGLSTKPVFHSNLRRADTFANVHVQSTVTPGATNTSAGTPGLLTVVDFGALYNVNPLYTQGVTGVGRTIGIVTLASFTPSDAFKYWSSLNLNVDPNRLTVVNIDGGPGAPSDHSGSDETTLDVEQSGGIAPAAKIIVYQAPNTDQGFVDAFAAAIQSNNADSISCSWGEWEGFDYLATPDVRDPFSGQVVTPAQAMHELFVMAALQGQSLFAAAGDAGAYDLIDAIENGAFGGGTFTLPLSVDYPAADTAITAAGGTTLPGTQVYKLPNGGTLSIPVPTERVWGWDYLTPLCNALQQDLNACGIFPAGTGGGVSVFSRVPFYQLLTAGVQTSQPGQLLSEVDPPAQTFFVFPAQFRGRNLPDVSLNADPQTGYIVYYTSNKHGFEVLQLGGTSFVAPQLAGVTALLTQNAGHRLGLLNPLLYGLALLGGTQGSNAVLNTISTGDNWFYSGRKGYSPAAGLGTLNVANLAKRIKQLAPAPLLAAQRDN